MTGIGRRCGLETSGEIQGLADGDALLGAPFADQFTDDHQTRRDADAHLRPLRRGEGSQCLDQPKSGADRALGIVLMRLGITEIDERAVAHVLGYRTAEPAYDVGAGFLEGAQYRAKFLRIEARGNRGGAYDVAKHDRKLATFAG